jgi:ATP-dependent exoDNAse (exonuclease V) beta subunit
MPLTPIRISGKNLGQLALVADFCKRCFWLKLHCQQRLPYQLFPGVFSSIDSLSKKLTAAHFRRYDRAPQWFRELGELKELVAVPHHSKFQVMDEPTGILLTGAPDDIVRKANGSLLVLDYKTSRFTENQDSLLPLYRIQLNSYAFICERIGMGNVSALALVYYEPVTDVDADSIDSVLHDDGFDLPHMTAQNLE